jgi:hypothetical protein
VLVATGCGGAPRNVGVKSGRIARLGFSPRPQGEVIAGIENAEIQAQLEASRRMVAGAEAQLVRSSVARRGLRTLGQRALARDSITTDALTGAQAAAAM